MARKEIIHQNYFTLPQLSAFSGLGLRFLRDALKDPDHPLPHFRINSKTILVSRLDFAEWLERFRARNNGHFNQIVDQVVKEVLNKKPRRARPGVKQ
ncbi:MAG: hypothetical protein ABSA09_01960 [Desulfobaccales bacterium]|jgi:hypothetical protein